jgi:hypothetical protein
MQDHWLFIVRRRLEDLDPQSESADFHVINDGARQFHRGVSRLMEAAGKTDS